MSVPIFSEMVSPDTLRIGNGYQASQLRSNRFDGLIDPIMLIDHFTLSASQEPYPYAGLSALTYLFEDSSPARYVESSGSADDEGLISSGDLYWLLAGRGTLHGEFPQRDGVVRGLRVFIELPSGHKLDAPAGYHLAAADMPVIQRAGLRVRLIAGRSKNVATGFALPQPFTMLDCNIAPRTRFAHPMPSGWNAVVYLIDGAPLIMTSLGKSRRLAPGNAIAVGTRGSAASLVLSPEDAAAERPSHAIVIALPATEEALALLEETGGEPETGSVLWFPNRLAGLQS